MSSPDVRTVLRVDHLSHRYGDNAVLDDVSYSVQGGDFVCIVGPSGVGKSTLLHCLSGLRRPSSGAVYFQEKEITAPPANMAVVFQDYTRSLMPWLSVLKNTMLPLRAAGVPKSDRRPRAEAALAEVGLADFAGYHPWQLSGGMQQRVAIARALACRPAAIIMDEPFASVDAQTRADLEDLVLGLRQHWNLTVVLVTHDIDEAVYLADHVVVLSGRPARAVKSIHVGLGRDRNQVSTKARPEFAELRGEVYGLIRRPDSASPKLAANVT